MNLLAGWPVRPGMRASIAPRAGHGIKELGRKDADEKLILDVQSGYVVARNDRTGDYSIIRRKTLWRYIVTSVPERSDLTVRVRVFHEVTGEEREWWMTDRQLRSVYLALKAAKRIPDYLAGRFDFDKARRSFIGGVPQKKR